MSLVEPLLEKEKLENPKPESQLNDPLANLEKSINDLSLQFNSFELDSLRDLEVLDDDASSKLQSNGEGLANLGIRCSISFENKLAIGRADGSIKIFDLESKGEVTLKGHTKAVNCLHFLKTSYFISSSEDRTITVWNATDYTVYKSFTVKEEVFCLETTSFQHFFSGSLNEPIVRRWFLWEDNDSEPFVGHENGITCMRCSSNDEILVTGSKDCTLRIWNVLEKKEIGVIRNNYGAIEQIIIAADNRRGIYAAGGQVVVYDFSGNQEICQWYTIAKNPLLLDATFQSNQFWTRQGQDIVRIYDLEQNSYSDFQSVIPAAAYSKRANLAYHATEDNSVAMFDISSSQRVNLLRNFNSKIQEIFAAGKNDEYLAVMMENGKIKIYEIFQEENEISKLKTSVYWDKSIWTSNNKYLIMAEGWKLTVWSLIEEKVAFEVEKYLYNVTVSSNEKYLIFGSDTNIYVYSLKNLKEVATVEIEAYKYRFAVSKDSKFIIIGRSSGRLDIFNIKRKSIDYTIEGGKSEILLIDTSYLNGYVVTADAKQNMTFWNLLKKIPEETFWLDKEPLSLTTTENGHLVLQAKNTAEIWNIQEKQKILSIDNDPGSMMNFKVSRYGNWVVFVQEGKIKIWSLKNMMRIKVLSTESPVNVIDLSNDGKYMAVEFNDRSAWLWGFEEKRWIVNFKDGRSNWRFTLDSKQVYWSNRLYVSVDNIEKYTSYTTASPRPFVIQGNDDKIFRQRYLMFLKNPAKELYDKQLVEKIVYPIGFSLLHAVCAQDNVSVLSAALQDGAEIFRDNQNMSPLSYALLKNSRRCIDQILGYIVDIEDEEKLADVINQIRDDIPGLFTSKSQFLVPLLDILFRRRAEKDQTGFYQVSEKLPMSVFAPFPEVLVSTFTRESNTADKYSANLIQFWGSPLGYNYTPGSDESLLLLKKMDECENQEIFQTLFVQSVIKEKWDFLWPGIITLSVIYWINLAIMVWYLFDSNSYILVSFLSVNGILAIYELLQLIARPKDYISDIWNLIDWTRIVLSFAWVFFEIIDQNPEGLSSAAILFNFIRGLTYFRAFDFTRFYVRLVLVAMRDSLAFLVIFLYSTFSFGVLYASLDANLSFSSMWTMAYELNMGNFDNNGFSFLQYFFFTLASLINVIMMLNLLVSTLGDTYDKFQMVSDELNSKEMLQLTIEFESLMFWARLKQTGLNSRAKLTYLQRCDLFQENDAFDKWQGKIKEFSFKIDGIKDEIVGIRKNISGELKKTEENMGENIGKIISEGNKKSKEVTNEKIKQLEEKVELMRQDWEPKINEIMEKIEAISAKL